MLTSDTDTYDTIAILQLVSLICIGVVIGLTLGLVAARASWETRRWLRRLQSATPSEGVEGESYPPLQFKKP